MIGAGRTGALLAGALFGLAPAGAAGASELRELSAGEREAVGQAMALLPAGLAPAGIRVAIGRPCDPADASSAVTVDLASRSIALCAAEQPEALRSQALVGAFLLADARLGWSRQPGWRRLNGWSRSATDGWALAAGNHAPGAYAAPIGRRSPTWELATFAAAWVAERAQDASGDGPLTCRLLPQARQVHRWLADLDPQPPLRPLPTCAAYTRWADRAQVAGVEVVLASPSTTTMASMFGHVFLRLVGPGEEEPERAALSDRTFGFLVEHGLPASEERLYVLKGIAGGYEATLVERSFLDTYRSYVINEGRDLRRFRLNLSATELDALLERLWSLQQAGSYQYFFFSTNCATLMVDLINSVLPDDRQAIAPEALATTPAGTLEGYAGVRAADGGPLLSSIPGSILSFEHEARRAAAERQRLAARLLAGADQGAVWRDVQSARPEVRAAAYQRLARERLPGDREDWRQFLRHSARVESFLNTLENLRAEEQRFQRQRADLAAALAELRARLASRPPGGCTAEIAPALASTGAAESPRRLTGYRALQRAIEGACSDAATADQLRRLALLTTAFHHESDDLPDQLRVTLLFPDPQATLGEQRFATGTAALIDYPFVTRLSPALLSVQQARAALGPAVEAGPGPSDLRTREIRVQAQEEAAADARAVGRTGIDELWLGTAMDRASGARPLLVLGGALHDERLGDQRRFGFPSHTALTVVRNQTLLDLQGSRPRLAAWEARLIGYRSLRPGLPGPRWRPRTGGEMYVDAGGRPGQTRGLELRAGAGWLLPIAASERLDHHLLITAGPLAIGQRHTAGAGGALLWGAGAALGLEGRLGLSPANAGAWLAISAAGRPMWTSAGPARELVGSAELRWPLLEQVRLPYRSGPTSALTCRLSAGMQAISARGPAEPLDRRAAITLALE